MKEQAAVFKKTYEDYLAQIAGIDLTALPARLGVRVNGNEVVIPFFGIPHRVSPAGIADPSGDKPNHAICVVLSKYLLMCPDSEPDGDEWAAFQDFKDAAPFADAYRKNVEQAIAISFGGRLDELKQACKILNGGAPEGINLPYDLAMWFVPLPRVPVFLLFNDGDNEFSTQCKVLFEKRAQQFLDMECLAILGMCLTDYLKTAANI
ncbi:MAG: hypothetical protein DRH32_05035 [Deltaproteobacteria bacterium]|nr:MAG: hypothetical protein DRH32_05035 [Deltaproteobacteria bacterium]